MPAEGQNAKVYAASEATLRFVVDDAAGPVTDAEWAAEDALVKTGLASADVGGVHVVDVNLTAADTLALADPARVRRVRHELWSGDTVYAVGTLLVQPTFHRP